MREDKQIDMNFAVIEYLENNSKFCIFEYIQNGIQLHPGDHVSGAGEGETAAIFQVAFSITLTNSTADRAKLLVLGELAPRLFGSLDP